MTFSQRKNSSGSKRLFSYIQNIGTSNETLVLKDNMETDSHSSVDTNKSEEDNLLSMAAIGALLPSEDTSHNISSSYHSAQSSPITKKDGASLKKYHKGQEKIISIDVHNIKQNISDQTMVNNNKARKHASTTPKLIHSAPSSSASQFNITGNTGLSNGYKHRSYTNGYSYSNYQSHSPHSPIYNIPTYTVTPSNTNSPTSYHNNASINNNNNAISSTISNVSYNNSSSNNNNSVFSNTTLNNQSSSVTSANSLTNRYIQESIEQNTNGKNHEDDTDNTPLNIVTSISEDGGHELNDNDNIINYGDLEENDDDELYNTTNMYSSSKPRSTRKQKSFYKRLMNQGGENNQVQEDYLDIKRDDTRVIHDIFQKSVCSDFNLCFKDPYTEISYNRYINNKFLHFWKKCVIILALTIFISQIFVIFSDEWDKEVKKVYEIILLDVFGLAFPVIVFYYIIYRLNLRLLYKLMPYLAISILFFMGPVLLMGPSIIVKSTLKSNYDIILFMYISLFFVGHYLLFYSYKPAIFSVTIYCICWILYVVRYHLNAEKGYPEIELAEKPKNYIYILILTISIFCLISVVMVYSLYKKERTSRRQFLNEQRLMRINSKLVSQLNRIERGFADEAADLDAPIEKAIITIRSLMASPTIGPEHLKALGLVLCYLQVPNLFAPDLDRQVTQGLKMDDERKNWLFSEVAHRKQIERSKRSSSSESSSGAGSHSPFYNPSPSIHDHQSEYQIINIDNYLTNHSAELLTRINEYNFPMFEYFNSTSRPLLTMSYHIFVKSGLLSRLHLSVNQFLNFMSAVEDGYHPEHQFHNAEHASDVLHCVYYFSTIPNIATCFKDLDYLGMYIAAGIHDFDHPGVNNKFLINIGDPLAELYNDKSVLENHHCSAALKLLNKPGNNFIERLDKEKKRELRETIIELVLATDLSGHFAYLTSFKKKLLDTLTCSTREDRLLLMQMIIKCSDVSNPTKSRAIYKEWINRCMSEFFSQGDREKQLNITVSPFCNRDNANVYSCQKGFIDFVAAPIFEAVGEFIGKYKIDKNANQKQLQISSANTTLSRDNSVQVNSSNDTSITSQGSINDPEKQKIGSSSSTNDENNVGNTSTLRQSKSYYHKKTYSKLNLLESQERVEVILEGLKSNKDWIDSNAAKTESSS